jgi:hypothetical protein
MYAVKLGKSTEFKDVMWNKPATGALNNFRHRAGFSLNGSEN